MVTYIELCDLENSKEAKAIFSFMHNCMYINGQKGKDPEINFLYFKHCGTKEELLKAGKELGEFYKNQNKVANKLEKQLENSPKSVNKIKESFYFLGVEHYVEIERKD